MQQQGLNGVSTNNINVHTESGKPQPPSAVDVYAFSVAEKVNTMQKWFIVMCLLFLLTIGCLVFTLLRIDYTYKELHQTTVLMKYNLQTTESTIRALQGGLNE